VTAEPAGADETVRLFSYGTLRQPDVQMANFGRLLATAPDVLPGYRLSWLTITDPEVIRTSGSDRHPILTASGDPADEIEGAVLLLTLAELMAADAYEVDDYRRVSVRLKSGLDAWVYIKA
jgi:hypothetical protein